MEGASLGAMKHRFSRPLGSAAVLLLAVQACSGGDDTSAAGGTTSAAGGTSSSSTSTTTPPTTTSTPGSGGSTDLPDKFTVTGVVTDGSAPVAGAIVMQAGGSPDFTTGPDGAFSIELTNDIPGTPTVVAAKIGYRSAGAEFLVLPDGPTELILLAVNPPDNPGYKFEPPGTGDPAIDNSTAVCGHCHTTFVAQYRTSAHAKATKDPLVQDLYAGVSEGPMSQAECALRGGELRAGLVPGTESDVTDKCYAGGGVLPDLNPSCGAPGGQSCDDPALPAAQKPTAFGQCADCHAPGMDGPAGGRNLHEAVGIAFDAGNHCDVCHKARDVDLTKPAGVAGALVLQRPHEKVSDQPGAKTVQVMFGPLPDVPNAFMGGSLQPKFSTSELCGACHLQRQGALLQGSALDPGRWPEGLPTHDTYTEWEQSTYNTPGTPCQFCHMPPDDTGLKSTVDVTNESNASIAFGFVRPPEQIRKHIFRGPLQGAPRMIDLALNLSLSTTVSMNAGGDTEVTASVTLQNTGAGHAIPTGEPMRALVLVVRATGCAADWPAVDGMTVQDGGGSIASGIAGADVQANGAALAWPGGAAAAKPGMTVRVVRPTGAFDDYPGVGYFADPSLTPAEKGLEVFAPVGESIVTTASAGSITLTAAIALQAGDIVYLGEPLPAPPSDGEGALPLAGAAGYTFAKTLVDPTGERHVHHYRAVDIASDNRIPPLAMAKTTHTFRLPAGCSAGKVTAVVLYRPVPVDMARLRGWDARDWVVAQANENVTAP